MLCYNHFWQNSQLRNLPTYFGSEMYALDETQQVFMQWIGSNAPESGQSVFITSSPGWETNAISEWFPVLVNREDVKSIEIEPAYRFILEVSGVMLYEFTGAPQLFGGMP